MSYDGAFYFILYYFHFYFLRRSSRHRLCRRTPVGGTVLHRVDGEVAASRSTFDVDDEQDHRIRGQRRRYFQAYNVEIERERGQEKGEEVFDSTRRPAANRLLIGGYFHHFHPNSSLGNISAFPEPHRLPWSFYADFIIIIIIIIILYCC